MSLLSFIIGANWLLNITVLVWLIYATINDWRHIKGKMFEMIPIFTGIYLLIFYTIFLAFFATEWYHDIYGDLCVEICN
jgi:hypothetical protein